MLVTHQNLEQVLADLLSFNELSLDTESYGVLWNDRLFSIQISTEKSAYYFNFLDYKDGTFFFDETQKRLVLAQLKLQLFSKKSITWYMHNAKFDMRRLAIEGCYLEGNTWDTMCMERFVRNNYMFYSLDECLKRRGWSKSDEVTRYIATHAECRSTVKIPGKKAKESLKHYDKVPFSIMYEYGLIDARECFKLGKDQQTYFNKNTSLLPLIANEQRLTKAVFRMETNGVKIDLDYCSRAMDHELKCVNDGMLDLSRLTGSEYKNGPKWLANALDTQGVQYLKSEKGNPVFDKKALKTMDDPITNKILEVRDHEKLALFYASFIHMADDGLIHANYNSAGTDSGRFSCSNPNMQQLPKKDKKDAVFSVREACVPREGFIYVALDYDAMEYRLAADYAGETQMIEAIKGGLDPHSYVAKMMGIEDRNTAKTLNFMKLYSGGLAKLALSLFKPLSNEAVLKLICKKHVYNSNKLSVKEVTLLSQVDREVLKHDIDLLRKAQEMEEKYNEAMPKLKPLVDKIKATALGRGFVFNRYGRRSYLDDPRFVYAMLNYLIQGTGGDIIKHVIVKVDELLRDKKSMLVACIHDELLAEIHETELDLIPKIKEIMENEYVPMNGMNLTAGAGWSKKSFAVKDRIEGIPSQKDINGGN